MDLTSLFLHNAVRERDGVEFIDTFSGAFSDDEKARIWTAFDVIGTDKASIYYDMPRVPRKVDGGYNHIMIIKRYDSYGIKRFTWDTFHNVATMDGIIAYIEWLYSDRSEAL